jgi:hypothetical protein
MARLQNTTKERELRGATADCRVDLMEVPERLITAERERGNDKTWMKRFAPYGANNSPSGLVVHRKTTENASKRPSKHSPLP